MKRRLWKESRKTVLENNKNINEEAKKILEKQLADDKLTHAYLLVANDKNLLISLAKDFTKEIVGSAFSERIDNETLLDFKVVRTDKMVIAKEEIKELQTFLRDKPIETTKKVYIIEEAEKMSNVAANALLKDLEEPGDDVIAILTTTNDDNVLPTLKSRCSVLNLSNTSAENQEIAKLAKKFVEKYEKNEIETYVYLEELVFQSIKERNEMVYFFEEVIAIYNEKLHQVIKDEKQRKLIMEKIKIFMAGKKLLFLNVNMKLMFDKLFFLLKEAKNENDRRS